MSIRDRMRLDWNVSRAFAGGFSVRIINTIMRRRLRFVAIVGLLTLFFAVYEFSDSFNGDFCAKNDDECNRPSLRPTVLQHHHDVDVAVVKNDEDDDEPVKVIITFTNAAGKEDFQNKFAVTIGSLMKFCSRKVVLYILGDSVSQGIANEIIGREVLDQSKIEVSSSTQINTILFYNLGVLIPAMLSTVQNWSSD